MGRGAPGITKEIGDVAMSLASQLESVHESRRIAQHEIKTDQACQFAEMKRRQDAIAKARPRPAPTGRWAKPKPKNEAQTILHQQPQTTQQHIGHHSIPNIPPPKPKTPAKLCAPDHSSPRHPALQADRAPPRVQVRVSEVREELPQQYEQRVRPPPGLPRRQERRRVSKALPLSSPATRTRRSASHSMPHSLGCSPATASPAPLQTLSLPAERALLPNPNPNPNPNQAARNIRGARGPRQLATEGCGGGPGAQRRALCAAISDRADRDAQVEG